MSHFNQFVQNSVAKFGCISNPINLSETFNVNVSGSPFEYYKKPKRFQITGQITGIQFSGLSTIRADKLQAKCDIAEGKISIDATIPNIQVIGQYKLACAIQTDISWTATGSFSISGKNISQGMLLVKNWKFEKNNDDTISLGIHAPLQLHLFTNPQMNETILGVQKHPIEDLNVQFKDLFPGKEMGKISDNLKIAISRAIGKEVLAQLQLVLNATLAEGLREHLQTDINAVGFFNIMSGCVIPPQSTQSRSSRPNSIVPIPISTPNTNASTPEVPPPAYGDVFETEEIGRRTPTRSTRESAHIMDAPIPSSTPTPTPSARPSLLVRKELTTSASNISEVVLSTETKHTEDGILVKLVTEKTIFFKYK